VGKNKLKRFAENETFPNVFQPVYDEVLGKDYDRKGNWKAFFGNDRKLTLELGCGKGEYTIGLAKLFPGRNFMGLDIKGARFWRGAKTAEEEGIKNVAFIRTRIHFIASLLGKEDEVEEIWITFPDPQPRVGKQSKRLTSPEFLERYRKFALPGTIVNLKTDSRELYDYTLEEVVRPQGLEVLVASTDVDQDFPEDPVLNIRTFYEKMWRKEGKKINYLRFKLNP
jgi:tRNA (guanine-N7-)-methyltransferase